jgi:sec-independent protein translocase protein TatA
MRLGVGEIVVVLVLALLFFGPSKLPQLGASLGQALKSFKKGLSSLHDEVDVSAAMREEPKDAAPQLSGSTGSPAERKSAAAVEDEKAPPS